MVEDISKFYNELHDCVLKKLNPDIIHGKWASSREEIDELFRPVFGEAVYAKYKNDLIPFENIISRGEEFTLIALDKLSKEKNKSGIADVLISAVLFNFFPRTPECSNEDVEGCNFVVKLIDIADSRVKDTLGQKWHPSTTSRLFRFTMLPNVEKDDYGIAESKSFLKVIYDISLLSEGIVMAAEKSLLRDDVLYMVYYVQKKEEKKKTLKLPKTIDAFLFFDEKEVELLKKSKSEDKVYFNHEKSEILAKELGLESSSRPIVSCSFSQPSPDFFTDESFNIDNKEFLVSLSIPVAECIPVSIEEYLAFKKDEEHDFSTFCYLDIEKRNNELSKKDVEFFGGGRPNAYPVRMGVVTKYIAPCWVTNISAHATNDEFASIQSPKYEVPLFARPCITDYVKKNRKVFNSWLPGKYEDPYIFLGFSIRFPDNELAQYMINATYCFEEDIRRLEQPYSKHAFEASYHLLLNPHIFFDTIGLQVDRFSWWPFIRKGRMSFDTIEEAQEYLNKSFLRYSKYFQEEKPLMDSKLLSSDKLDYFKKFFGYKNNVKKQIKK